MKPRSLWQKGTGTSQNVVLGSANRHRLGASPLLPQAANANPQRWARMTSLSHVYRAWHELEPDKGYDQKADEWRAKLAEWQASTQPATQPSTQPTTQPATAFP